MLKRRFKKMYYFDIGLLGEELDHTDVLFIIDIMYPISNLKAY